MAIDAMLDTFAPFTPRSSPLTAIYDEECTAADVHADHPECLHRHAVRPPVSSLPSHPIRRRAHRGQRSQAARFRRRGDLSSHGSDFFLGVISHEFPDVSQGLNVPPPPLRDASPEGTAHLSPPSDVGPGKSRVPALQLRSITCKFRVFHLNVNGFDAHIDLIDTLLSLHDFPELVVFTETKLTKIVEKPMLTRYTEVSRKDRTAHGGGVIVFSRSDVSQNIAFEKESETLELLWHTLHTDIGPMLFGAWYRPPRRGEKETIIQLDRELSALQTDYVGCLLVGDMNVHHSDWLVYSNGISPEGRELEAVSVAHGLTQMVEDPTRGEYLLDLVLTDLAPHVSCIVAPGVLDKDHRAVIATVDVHISTANPVSREVFNFGKAKWRQLQCEFENMDWAEFFRGKSADSAADSLSTYILEAARRFIPIKSIIDKPYCHPWIDDRCRELLQRKHNAIGTEAFIVARDACTAGFAAAHHSFFI